MSTSPEFHALVDLMERTFDNKAAWKAAGEAKADLVERTTLAIVGLEAAKEAIEKAIAEAKRQRTRASEAEAEFRLALKEAEHRIWSKPANTAARSALLALAAEKGQKA